MMYIFKDLKVIQAHKVRKAYRASRVIQERMWKSAINTFTKDNTLDKICVGV